MSSFFVVELLDNSFNRNVAGQDYQSGNGGPIAENGATARGGAAAFIFVDDDDVRASSNCSKNK